MARRSRQGDPERIREELLKLLVGFEVHLESGALREQAKALIPVNQKLRDLGSSLVIGENGEAAIGRILLYLKKYVGEVIAGDELMVVGGISEYARRVRELRVELGWAIISGSMARDLNNSTKEEDPDGERFPDMRVDDYMLLPVDQDREAAFRWKIANRIRKKDLSVKDKVLEFLRENVGKPVSGEELRYLVKNKTEWARRVRELRTDHGWPVATRSTGRPELPVGYYVLETNQQTPKHDRRIPDPIRRRVLVRDGHTCQSCDWKPSQWNQSDPRHLELHHRDQYADGGKHTEENLVALCSVCHHEVHSSQS